MAKLPHELLKLSGLGTEAKARLDRLYAKLAGLCRWFGVGLNGMLFPAEEGEPPVSAPHLIDLLNDRSEAERERIHQFMEEMQSILLEHEASYEGTFEILDADMIGADTCVVKVVYTMRPFWRWY